MSMRLMLLALLGMAGYAAADSELPPVKTVPHVDLKRYMGLWYEVASIPQWFQSGCVASTAQYELRSDGRVNVLNSCRKGTLEGKLKTAKGIAWVVDADSYAKLKVRFFWPFSGDYWVIDLGPNYEYAVVGHPGRNYLWILSRTPQMDPKAYMGIIERLNEQHYDVSRLRKTLQPSQNEP
jgi:apolipoprotein D and lipocalin family protein